VHSPFTLNTYVISSTAVSAAKVMLNWGVKVMRSFWNACLFVLFLVCFPFLCIFSCRVFEKSPGTAMSLKCDLSRLEIVETQPTCRTVLELFLAYFPSLSKHLKAVNKSKLATCCVLSVVNSKEHAQSKAIPIDSGQKLTCRATFQYTELLDDLQAHQSNEFHFIT